MAYCSQADLEALVGEGELIQLTDPAGLAVNAATVADAIRAADARIDGVVRGAGYALPLPASAAGQLRPISRDFALYELYGTRITPESAAYLRHKASRAELDRIGRGDSVLDLGDAPAGEADPPTGPAVAGRATPYTAAYLAKVY